MFKMRVKEVFCWIGNIRSLPININRRKVISSNCYFSTSVYLIDDEKSIDNVRNSACTYTMRNFTCGDLRTENVGCHVTLCGWLEYRRLDRFLILRDGYGETQLIIKDNDKLLKDRVKNIPLESILKVKGTCLSRPKNMVNTKLSTGEIEVSIDELNILNQASDLPFNIRGFQMPKESLRMQYRYLDLRYPQMQRNLRFRSNLLFKMRQFLIESNFVDVETPTLFRATPGGAQEFIVPTKFPGQFYSLVQSPQQFKQILMAGGIDRYFQVARCYRDETSRPDRQPEFTQLDIEMSFTTAEEVMALVEDLLSYCWPSNIANIPRKFEKIKYTDALEWYGTDKPDISFDFKLCNITNILKSSKLNTYDETFGAYCLHFPKGYALLPASLKTEFKMLSEQFPKSKLIQNKISTVENWIGAMSKLFTEEMAYNLKNKIGLQDNSVLMLSYGTKKEVLDLLSRIRNLYVSNLEKSGLKIRNEGMNLAWIVDFPLFEWNSESDSLNSAHHPFTSPNPEDLHILHENPLKVRALAYDLVLNGNEIAGGSIRIHDPSLQETIFKMLNIDIQNMKHILEMLGSGCPPHGGIAVGLDRLLSIILKTPSIRDVIAFPKGAEGRDLLSGAPSTVSEKDLQMYHIQSIK